MVGPVVAAVEGRKHAVADELLQFAAELTRDERCGDSPVRLEHGRDLGRRRALGETCKADEVAEQDRDLLMTFACRRQVEVAEALVTPFAPGREPDDHVRRHDQAVPFPPARVPLPLSGHRHPDHRLRQQQEAGDDGDGQEAPPMAEDRPVARRADPIDERADDRQHGQQTAVTRARRRVDLQLPGRVAESRGLRSTAGPWTPLGRHERPIGASRLP
jgi:hypothetical protein